MIVDTETHVFQVIDLPGYPRFEGCRVENLLADMDRAGVDQAILTSYDPLDVGAPDNPFRDPEHPSLGPNPIEYTIASWQQHGERFYWFSCPDPRKPNCRPLLEEHYMWGLAGLGELCPAYQHLLPDAPEMKLLYRFADEKGLPVILNSENWDDAENYFSGTFDQYFDRMEKVFREYPEVRFMIGHGGGDCGHIAYDQPEIEAYLARNQRSYEMIAEWDNLWVAACMPWWFAGGQVLDLVAKQLDFLRAHVGFSKVAWGSDWPWLVADMSFRCDYPVLVDCYRNFPCAEDEREYLLGKAAYEFITGQRAPGATQERKPKQG